MRRELREPHLACLYPGSRRPRDIMPNFDTPCNSWAHLCSITAHGLKMSRIEWRRVPHVDVLITHHNLLLPHSNRASQTANASCQASSDPKQLQKKSIIVPSLLARHRMIMRGQVMGIFTPELSKHGTTKHFPKLGLSWIGRTSYRITTQHRVYGVYGLGRWRKYQSIEATLNGAH
jgi:hypothetical protein